MQAAIDWEKCGADVSVTSTWRPYCRSDDRTEELTETSLRGCSRRPVSLGRGYRVYLHKAI